MGEEHQHEHTHDDQTHAHQHDEGHHAQPDEGGFSEQEEGPAGNVEGTGESIEDRNQLEADKLNNPPDR